MSCSCCCFASTSVAGDEGHGSCNQWVYAYVEMHHLSLNGMTFTVEPSVTGVVLRCRAAAVSRLIGFCNQVLKFPDKQGVLFSGAAKLHVLLPLLSPFLSLPSYPLIPSNLLIRKTTTSPSDCLRKQEKSVIHMESIFKRWSPCSNQTFHVAHPVHCWRTRVSRTGFRVQGLLLPVLVGGGKEGQDKEQPLVLKSGSEIRETKKRMEGTSQRLTSEQREILPEHSIPRFLRTTGKPDCR